MPITFYFASILLAYLVSLISLAIRYGLFGIICQHMSQEMHKGHNTCTECGKIFHRKR